MIPLLKVFVAPDAASAVADVLSSGYIGQGPKVDELESKLEDFLGIEHGHLLTLNSCTSALQLALRLAGVGHGDEVVSTPATCMPTNSSIYALGGEVVWADIDPRNGLLSAQDVARKMTPQTKAVITMDWGGTPGDLAGLKRICAKHRAKLIVDAAHSFGAKYNGAHEYKVADMVCHSFQAVKAFTTADGGALVCASKEDADRGRLLRWFGIDRTAPPSSTDMRCEADIKEHGYKFHMNDVSASIGLANLQYMPELLATYRANAAYYDSMFSGTAVKSPFIPECREPSRWLYTVLVPERDRVMLYLKEHGIMSSKVHARNDAHSVFSTRKAYLPGVDEFYQHQLSVPVGWWLSESEREMIANKVLAAVA